MKSVMMFLFAALVSVSMSAANPEWYAVYKMTSTTTSQMGGVTSKTRSSGYLMIGISVYADTIRAEQGNVLKFTKGEGKVHTTQPTNLQFEIRNTPSDPSWVGSSFTSDKLLLINLNETMTYGTLEGIVGGDYKLTEVDHCIPQGSWYLMQSEVVPLTLDGYSTHVGVIGVETTKSSYKLDLWATQIVNMRRVTAGESYNLNDAVAAFALYLQQHGGSLAE